MMNATLVIHNSEKFSDDIWQYKNDFTQNEWVQTKDEWLHILKELYDIHDGEINPDIDNRFTDSELYILGDLINMLSCIDIRKEEE